mmetsp:Transcript_64271/g.114701  ORF Transcript_64271/g.114701 Transcript_64271/m.114701 type:complete len:279 (-) Transcript_64271:135-971(-)
MTLILKNTFLDVVEPEEKVHARRSLSIPPTWKPLNPCREGCDWDGDLTLQSDASTRSNWSAAESDDESSPMTAGSSPSLCLEAEEGDSDASDTQTPSSGKLTLCLDATVTSTIGASPAGSKTKLSSKAAAFAPHAAVPDEIRYLVEQLREVLQASPDILSVKVSEGFMGGSTTVLAEVRSCSVGAAMVGQTSCLLKATLLNTAAESESTYVLGYKSQPFQDTADGFKATVSCVSSLQEHSVCWDTYELGYCPRRNTCRWCHPLSKDLLQIVVMFKTSD